VVLKLLFYTEKEKNSLSLVSCLFNAHGKGSRGKEGRIRMWQNWIIGSLGVWLIVASFTINGNLINELIVGIAVAILGFWTAVQS